MSTKSQLPAVEVTESDSEEAWQDFQDSVMQWEDQFATTDLTPLEPEVQDTVPAPLLDDFDAFSSVTKNSP